MCKNVKLRVKVFHVRMGKLSYDADKEAFLLYLSDS